LRAALGMASGGSSNPIATTQPELLESELAATEARIIAMESQYTPSHPTVVALRRQAENLRQMLKSAKSDTREVPSAARNRILMSPGAKGAKSEFFEDLSKKINFLDIAMELERGRRDVPYIEVVEKPTLPLTYIFPNRKNFMLGGFLAGILLSSIAVGFLQLKRASQLTPQFASRFLDAPLIGILPPLRTHEANFIETSLGGGLKNAPVPGRRR
jgi:capsule polysaccharide export protein KpsE/RkpR